MYYRFIVEAWTNEPIHVEVELQRALHLHPPLNEIGLSVTHRELTSRITPKDVGKSEGGDQWRYFLEGETDSPVRTCEEIEKAIRKHGPAAQLELVIRPGFIPVASPDEREQTVEDVERWLLEGQDEQSR